MTGRVLVTHQTGPKGKEVKRLYMRGFDILKEFYLSCLIDRETSKIAYIVQKVEWILVRVSETPNKIVTIKIDLKKRDLVKKKLKR